MLPIKQLIKSCFVLQLEWELRTISISELVFILNWIVKVVTGNRIALVDTFGLMMLILQHCIITGLLKRVRKVFSYKKEVAVTN